MMPLERELVLHRFLAGLRAKLAEARDVEQAARAVLRDTAQLLEAQAACLASDAPEHGGMRLDFALRDETGWDLGLLGRFFAGEHPEIPPTLLLAALRRKARPWRVLALRREAGRPFARGDRKLLLQVAETASELVQRIDRERIAEVRSRIERKIMQELRAQDLFYQILHGLRSLTGYDHSAALLIGGEGGDALQLVAEQIAWRKGKSGRIGLRLPLDSELGRLMGAGGVFGFSRAGEAWHEWTGGQAGGLARLLDFDAAASAADPARERAMLCAPLLARDGVLGVLKVASRRTAGLGPYEAQLVEQFMPQVAVAIQNSRRAESLEAKMLEGEKKHAMADLARGVAHDLNNALGSILPLVQQLREDSLAGQIDPELLATDLEQIERSMQVCRRIFGGMLAFARGAARGPARGDVRRAVDSALTLLADGIDRRRIRCEVAIAVDLPTIRGSQSDLEQLFFNLMTNARDAMPGGGVLRVGAERQEAQVLAFVEDTGVGIAERDLPRVQEPFFSTKPHGSGLGLAICRSIVWGLGGKLTLRSRQGEGTRVELVLPAGG